MASIWEQQTSALLQRATRTFGADVTYTYADGVGVVAPVRVVEISEAAAGVEAVPGQVNLSVQVSAMPKPPGRGDRLFYKNTGYLVTKVVLDSYGAATLTALKQ